jgi:thiol:disulfide interchange protein
MMTLAGTTRRAYAAALALMLFAPLAAAEDLTLPGVGGDKVKRFEDAASVSMGISPKAARRGEAATLTITITPKAGWHTYPFNVPGGQLSQNTLVLPQKFLLPVGEITDPPGWEIGLDGSGRNYEIPVTWDIPVQVAPNAPVGKTELTFPGSTLQVCKQSCFNLKKLPAVAFEVLPGEARDSAKPAPAPPTRGTPPTVTPTAVPALVEKPAGEGAVAKVARPTAEYRAQLDAVTEAMGAMTPVAVQGGFWGLIAAAVVWGFISLATPCVFPMIPITVSLFMKHGNQSTAATIRLALVYCLTIIVVLGAAAVFLLAVFQRLSVNPYMNLFLAGLFVFFALSLFGMYDITLPNFLLQGAESGRRIGGTVGTVFGAVAFSIVSFTCVAPFLGGFAGLVATGNYSTAELVLAGVAFATAFASPFFLLALFPTLLKRMPRSGGWLDTVKAVMGFLELAAALKFLRTAELALTDKPELVTYDVALAAWVGIAAVAGLYLLNMFRLPHDEEKPNVGVMRMLFGVGMVVFAVYLTPGLFGQRPAGTVYAWVNSFLLPNPGERAKGLRWTTDLKGEIDRIVAEKSAGRTPERGLIFIDFTGVTCTNCTLNENNVFTQPAVSELLTKYTPVKLYTDYVPADYYVTPPDVALRQAEAVANYDFQESRFGTTQLPLYVILDPQADGRVTVRGVYDEGKINDVPRFVAFLAGPLAK